MSAFVVNEYHLHRLIATGMDGPTDKAKAWGWNARDFNKDGPDVTGQMLHDANVRSVNHRYPYHDAEQEQPYTFAIWTPPMSSVEALKALACYEYQSCEPPEWMGSPAQEWCERLRSAIIDALPGYDDAPWEQTERTRTAV
jgi:hypothetical protein